MSPKVERPKAPYLQVADGLRDRIESGELKPGDHAPSERELADEWGISRATATKALAVLRAEQFVESKQGVGTMVRARRFVPVHLDHRDYPTSAQERLVHARTTGRIRSEDEQSVVLVSELREPTDAARMALRLGDDEQAICRIRVSSRSGTPIELCTSWFSGALATSCPALLAFDHIEQGTTQYVEQQLGVLAGDVEEAVTPTIADAEDAALLNVEAATAIIKTEVTISTKNGPLAYEVYRHPEQQTRSYSLPPPRA